MITMLRSKLQGLGFRIAMGILLFIIAIVWVMPQVPQITRQFTNDWIIDINGQKVLYQDFMRKYHLADQQLQVIKQQYGPYADYFLQNQGIPTDPQVIAFNELTTEELLNQAAHAIPIDIGSEYIQQKLSDRIFIQSSGLAQLLPVDLIGPNGAIDQTLLRYYLQKINLSATQFEALLEHALERFVVAELIGLAAYVPSLQVNNFFKQQYVQKKYSILIWSLERMVEKEKQTPITDDELQQFYSEQTTQHKRYWVPEKRSGQSWIFKPDTYGVTVSDDDVQRYYDRNKLSFIERPVQIQVRRILFRINDESIEQERYQVAQEVEQKLKQDSALFAQLAKEYSDDKATALNGGLMEPFSKGKQSKLFEQSAFLLKKDGDISNIVKTDDGFEIIQRVSRQPVSYKPLVSVAQDIKQELLVEAFKKQLIADIRQLPKKPSLEQLEVFARRHSATKKEAIAPVADEGSALARALFTLKRDEITSVIDQNQGVLVYLAGIHKRYLPALDQIRSEVASDLYTARALNAQQEQIEQVRNKARTESFEQIKQQYGLNLEQTGLIDINDEKTTEQLKDLGVPVSYFAALEKVGGVLEYHDNTHGYLIRLDEQGLLNNQVYLEKEPEIRADLYRTEIRRYVEGFVASLHRNATIDFNESIIAKLKDHA